VFQVSPALNLRLFLPKFLLTIPRCRSFWVLVSCLWTILLHTNTHTCNRFTALWILSGTTRVSLYQKKHSHTHTYRGHQSSLICFLHLLYDPWHHPCSIYVPGSLFSQSLSKFSLVYLLAWHPQLHTPYISSFSFLTGQVSLPCNIQLRVRIQAAVLPQYTLQTDRPTDRWSRRIFRKISAPLAMLIDSDTRRI